MLSCLNQYSGQSIKDMIKMYMNKFIEDKISYKKVSVNFYINSIVYKIFWSELQNSIEINFNEEKNIKKNIKEKIN